MNRQNHAMASIEQHIISNYELVGYDHNGYSGWFYKRLILVSEELIVVVWLLAITCHDQGIYNHHYCTS